MGPAGVIEGGGPRNPRIWIDNASQQGCGVVDAYKFSGLLIPSRRKLLAKTLQPLFQAATGFSGRPRFAHLWAEAQDP